MSNASSDTTQWFYSDQGTQQGPVDFATLRARVMSGALQPTDQVWREGMADWAAAGSVSELFGAGVPAAGHVPDAYAAGATYNSAPIPMAYYGVTPGSAEYIGFWWRVLAYIIDYFVTYVVGFIIGLIIGVTLAVMMGPGRGVQDAITVVAGVVGFVMTWLYFSLMESSKTQATLGKMAIGVRVVDDMGNRLSFGRATGRFFAKILSALILGIGFIMIGLTDRKQGLHDLIASTFVVRGRPNGGNWR